MYLNVGSDVEEEEKKEDNSSFAYTARVMDSPYNLPWR
jgi:hypothetical protein